MLVRSSRFHEVRVEYERAVLAREQALKDLRLARAEQERLQRELHERRSDYMERLLYHEVVAHLRSDFSIEGHLVGSYADTIVLRHACTYNPETGDTLNLEGDVVIRHDNLSFIQDRAAPSAPASKRDRPET